MTAYHEHIDRAIAPDNHIRVLILEDNPDDVVLMQKELDEADFDTDIEVVSNLESFRTALSTEIDLILADYTLPQSTALDAIKILKQSEFDIPLIVVTGSVGEEVAVNCMREGASDYILKDRRKRLAPAAARVLQEKKTRLQREQAEHALAKSEKAHRLFFNTSPIPTWVHDPESYSIHAVNDTAVQTFGYTRAEILKTTALELLAGPFGDRLHNYRLHTYLENRSEFPGGIIISSRTKGGEVLKMRLVAKEVDFMGMPATICTAEDLTEIIRAREENQKLITELKAVSQRLQETQEKERKRIANDLHDEVGASLTALMIEVELLGDKSSDQAAVEKVKSSIKHLMTQIRKVIFDLRPSTLGTYELKNVLKNYFEHLMTSSQLDVNFTAKVPDGLRFPDKIETVVFRIVQEATTNILRHSGVKKAECKLEYSSLELTLTITDRGSGFDTDSGFDNSIRDHRGLTSMRERAEVVGGDFSIESDDTGTSIFVSLPARSV